MISLKALIDELALDLHDNDVLSPNIAFTRPALEEYIKDGLRYISLRRPALLSGDIDVELVEGRRQTLPAGVTTLLSVEGTLENGRIGKRPTKTNVFFLTTLPDDKCLDKTPYEMSSYSFDEKLSSRSFTVNPPVPRGEKVVVRVIASRNPAGLINGDEIDVEDWVHLALYEYAMYRSFQMDMLSPNSQATANIHFAQFQNLMKETGDVPSQPS